MLWSDEAQSGNNILLVDKPAALMSTANLKQPAAEVFQDSQHKSAKLTTSNPTPKEELLRDKSIPSMVPSRDDRDFERSISLTPLPEVTASTRWNTVSTAGNGLEEEVNRWSKEVNLLHA